MSYQAAIIADSVSPAGVRLTTLQVTFPRFILAEFNTHRMLSRNSASSRAVPMKKRIEEMYDGANVFMPEPFTANQPGMQGTPLGENDATNLEAGKIWVVLAAQAVVAAQQLAGLGIHKQHAARVMEPFAWHTAVVTATDWDNFFHLRCHPDAQPEFQRIAAMMRDAMCESQPGYILDGQWHLPYVLDEEVLDGKYSWAILAQVSCARCARVSYLTHDGKRDIQADLDLAAKLLKSGHMSPFEHAATPMDTAIGYYGNFKGWMSYRKLIPNESDPLGSRPTGV